MAVSDVLSESVELINFYLKPPSLYEGEMRERIEKLVAEMTAIREELDTPPSAKRT